MHVSIVFCSACTMLSYRKFTFAISSLDEFLVLYKLDAQASVTLDKSTIFIPQ